MERYEALILIKENIDTIISELDKLKSSIEPELNNSGFKFFDVGVDVVETSVRDSIEYSVTVYTSKKELLVSDVAEIVNKAYPNYQGSVGICDFKLPYPVDSFLGLELLKDIKEASIL